MSSRAARITRSRYLRMARAQADQLTPAQRHGLSLEVAT
jgi:hypothetical protein